LALAAESKIEKTLLTNLASSWDRLANQTDRYVEFLKTPGTKRTLRTKSKAALVGGLFHFELMSLVGSKADMQIAE
jgi:hypothetical protein